MYASRRMEGTRLKVLVVEDDAKIARLTRDYLEQHGFDVTLVSDGTVATREALRPEFDALPFSPLYVTDEEMAAEIANRTVHGIMHMGWVREATGGYRGQMAVYVKPNGLLGEGYLAAIKPFRHLIVYPAMLRDIGRRWEGGP